MTDWLTVIPWGWYATGLLLIVVLLYAANWYMDRPETDTDRYCSAVDQELDAREAVRPLSSGVQVTTRIDPCDADAVERRLRWHRESRA